MKIIIGLYLLCIHLFADIYYDENLQEQLQNNEKQYLYISHLNDINKMDTMTYYIANNDNKRILANKIIKNFSKLIGRKNGFIFIERSINKKYINTVKIFKCDISNFQLNNEIIIFENRLKNNCIIFKISDSNDIANLNNILLLLLKNINNYKEIEKENIKIRIYELLYTNFNEYHIYQNNKEIIKDFIDFLIDYRKY
jgi:hypothetical protein